MGHCYLLPSPTAPSAEILLGCRNRRNPPFHKHFAITERPPPGLLHPGRSPSTAACMATPRYDSPAQDPSIAQLVERWTVDGWRVARLAGIHRSLVQFRLEGLSLLLPLPSFTCLLGVSTLRPHRLRCWRKRDVPIPGIEPEPPG